MLNQEEYAMYQKAVDYILRNLNNPDFNQILRQNGYKIIPCKLSYVIENLEKAGYIVSKPEVDTSIQPSTQTFNKEEILSFIKGRSLSLFALIKETTIFIKDNIITFTFDKNAFFKYKQCIENNNTELLKKYCSEFLNQNCSIDICIEK